jgi:hypothetical protein
VDASFYEGNCTGATGAVLRDHDGRTCGVAAKWYDHCLNALTAEALACRNGMQLALNRGVTRLLVETDCQVLVQLCNKQTTQRSEVDPTLYQMIELSRSFEFFELSFTHITCNRLTHECARLVSRGNPVDEWLVLDLVCKISFRMIVTLLMSNIKLRVMLKKIKQSITIYL